MNMATIAISATVLFVYCAVNPVFVTSDRNGRWPEGGYYVHNNMWNIARYNLCESTLYAWSHDNWYVVTRMNHKTGDVPSSFTRTSTETMTACQSVRSNPLPAVLPRRARTWLPTLTLDAAQTVGTLTLNSTASISVIAYDIVTLFCQTVNVFRDVPIPFFQ